MGRGRGPRSRVAGGEVAGGGGGRGAVVTGGAGGLGAATARRLAFAGFRVWVADLDGERAREVAAALPGHAVGVHLDVTEAGAVDALANDVDRAVGLAVWVNNAGVLPTGPVWNASLDEIDRTFAVNTRGLIHGTTAALDRMRGAGRGHIVNVVSLAGLVAAPGETVYAATKHAALAYTVGTALDLRHHGIRDIEVTAVCPDGIWTPMLHDKLDDPEAALSFSGGRAPLEADEVATAIVGVLARPRLVVSVPRWRGGMARAFAAVPGFARAALPLVLADARRKQRRCARSMRRRDELTRPR